MNIVFHKMHGLGNDFILIDNRRQSFKPSTEQLQQLANRHTGIGCDQFLILETASQPSAHLDFRIYNADGTEAEQCGNGMRCITHYLGMNGEISKQEFSINGIAGPVSCRWQPTGVAGQAAINMGQPIFESADIPLDIRQLKSLGNSRWQLQASDINLPFTGVSMGNPHIIFIAEDQAGISLEVLANSLSNHPAFPAGVNIGLIESYSASKIALSVFERGSGPTLACGSGACAAMAALRLAGKIDHRVTVYQPGGELVIEWCGLRSKSDAKSSQGESCFLSQTDNNELWMTGPASYTFKGEFRDEYKSNN
ncbi:MAG: diaminopimelate epimerase [Xanthomonadales bacterium]|nr:diaminopimelate epimerase [Xanthomonadales bacterium]